MKDFIFILGFLCYFVINTVAGQQTWKEEGSNVMAGFSELYKEDIKLEKTQDNQNDKINENKNEIEDIFSIVKLLVRELEDENNQLKEKVTEQDGKIVELQKLTVNNQNNINNNDERITLNSGK